MFTIAYRDGYQIYFCCYLKILVAFRKFFELKRKKVADCKRDELLGLRICKQREKTAMEHSLQVGT